MGEQKVSLLSDKKEMHSFVRHLLRDVQALEYMLENDWFEDDITRIGAEQEMCIVDNKTFRPQPKAMEVLELMKGIDWVETELAKFNLEIGATPLEFKDKALSLMEQEIQGKLDIIQERVQALDSSIILTGILPTLQKFDMGMHNLTPVKRYFALMEAINKELKRSAYELRLQGVDELLIKHDSPLLEACNTSFQVHLQVAPKDFVKMYNISQ
ncbi:MAG: CBS domain-containing protein, partial [Saprospiraceae bacterium]